MMCRFRAIGTEPLGRATMKQDSHTFPENVMDLLLDAICIVDLQGRFLFVSAAGERIFGYTPDEMLGKPMLDFVYHEDRERTIEAARKVTDGYLQLHFENRYVRKDGNLVHIMWSARKSETDQVRVAVARDVTARKRAEATQKALHSISEAAHFAEDLYTLFQRVHQILAGLLQAENFFVALYDKETHALTFPYHADRAGQVPTPERQDAAQLSADIISSGDAVHLAPEAGTLHDVVRDAAPDQAPRNWLGVPLNTKEEVIGALVVHTDGPETHYSEKDRELLEFVSAQVATAIVRKQMELRLHHMARHDPLTDLANRDLVHECLQTALARARQDHSSFAVLYLDLDNFKQINDALGHSVGDRLLQGVARRLKAAVRETDTVGRIGGDEYVVLLAHISPEHTTRVAEKIRSALSRPFELDGRWVETSSSIGVALYPEHADDDRLLIHYADEAMYAAKRAGGNRVQLAAVMDTGTEGPVSSRG